MLGKVKRIAISDDAVEFLALQLKSLPQATQNILKSAACIGHKFNLSTLAVVCGQSEDAIASELWKALKEGIIVPQNDSYKFYLTDETQTSSNTNPSLQNNDLRYRFQHDQVQQAVYSLIPEKQKKEIHYRIGKILLLSLTPKALEENIFELVNQLNYGKELIVEQIERDKLAQLNLIACRKAKASTAYQSEFEYAIIGISLLGKNAWQCRYDMNLEFHEELAESALLNGNFEEMEKSIEAVIQNARSLLDRVTVSRTKIQSNVSQNKLTEAIRIGKSLLQELGVNFATEITPEDIQEAILSVDELIQGREVEDLVNLPRMEDREKVAIIKIANSIIPAAYICGSPLFPILVAFSARLSIQYGNTSASASVFAAYGTIMCNMKQDIDKGVKFGQLALDIASNLNAEPVKPEVLNVVGSFILHRKFHLRETIPLLQEGYRIALEVGNLEFAGYTAHNFCLNSFWSGQSLVNLEKETGVYCNHLIKLNQSTTANWCRIYWQSILNLLGLTEKPSILNGKAFQETEFLPILQKSQDFGGLFIFYSYRLMLCYLFGDIESAQSHEIQVRNYLKAAPGIIAEPGFYFYDSLTALTVMKLDSKVNAQMLRKVEQNQRLLQQQWAYHAPMNHQHKVDLVEAEKCRILRQEEEAVEFYNLAISGAKANEYIQEAALANELAAKFYFEWGKDKVAVYYLKESHEYYTRWGAKAKTDELEKSYPQLIQIN